MSFLLPAIHINFPVSQGGCFPRIMGGCFPRIIRGCFPRIMGGYFSRIVRGCFPRIGYEFFTSALFLLVEKVFLGKIKAPVELTTGA